MDSATLWILWIGCSVLGYFLGKPKQREVAGAVWGLLLGPIGLLVVCCIPDETKKGKVPSGMKKCPECAEFIKSEAAKCKHCGTSLAKVARRN